jgi:hypothetical protein
MRRLALISLCSNLDMLTYREVATALQLEDGRDQEDVFLDVEETVMDAVAHNWFACSSIIIIPVHCDDTISSHSMSHSLADLMLPHRPVRVGIDVSI